MPPISEGGNVDLQTIIQGGDGFAERLKQFSEAAKAAAEVRASANALKAQAEAKMAEADRQLAKNRVAAEQLRQAQELAENERKKFSAKYAELISAARG